jgi:hypothetical protein
VGLLVGLWRHGFNHYDEIRRDPDLVTAFQVCVFGGRVGEGGGQAGGEEFWLRCSNLAGVLFAEHMTRYDRAQTCRQRARWGCGAGPKLWVIARMEKLFCALVVCFLQTDSAMLVFNML